jgi:fumarate hydratase subunit alpha
MLQPRKIHLTFHSVKSIKNPLVDELRGGASFTLMITQDQIKAVSARLYEQSLKRVPQDTQAVLRKAREAEGNDTARKTIQIMLESADAAQQREQLVCSDVGIPVYSVKLGTRAQVQGSIRQAIVDGFADLAARIDPPILKMVTNPLTHQRSYAGKDMPIITFDLVDDSDVLELICAPKAMGSGRWEALDTFVFPSLETIETYVLDTVIKAGSQPCPPIVVGVGIGGTFDYAARMAKQQVLRPVGQANPEPTLAAMEERLLKAINSLGFGPMGTGGNATAMAVHIDYAASHGFVPIAVALNCWINRRAGARMKSDSDVEWFE